MPLPADDPVSRRDETLARTRRASRWITTAALAAAVFLGAAFAHALPGHHVTAQAAPATPARAGGSGAQGASQRTGTPRHHARATHHHHHKARLQPPSQPPASTPAPPQTGSGGS
jgi:hypothetical protein